MRPLYRHLAIGVLAAALAACSDDGASTATPDDDLPGGVPVGGTDADGTPTTDGPFDTPTDGTPPATGAPTDGTPPATGAPTDGTPPATGAPTDGTPPITGTPTGDADVGPGSDAGIGTITASRPGVATDPTGVEVTLTAEEENDCAARVLSIYVRTLSEVCSLGGPSLTDGNRTDPAPSAPSGVTALLVADDWVQIDWIPSSDDGAVVEYEIRRDGQVVGTVTDPEFIVGQGGDRPRVAAQRYWRTTTYIDCDFTRFNCDLENNGPGRPQPGTTHEYTVVAIDGAGNRSAPSAPASFTLNTVRRGEAPDLTGYTEVERFTDEFDGAALDTDKWATSLSFPQFGADGNGRAVNGEQQFFVDTRGSDFGFPYNPFVLGDGTLKITAARTADVASLDAINGRTGRPFRDDARGQEFLSGAISSRDSSEEGIRYGYVEMRAKVPSGNGLLSTFFLFQPSANQYEIDILEYLGKAQEPNGAAQNYHYRDGFRFADNGIVDGGGNAVDGGNDGVAHASPTMFLEGDVDLSTEFHTYSVLWEPGLVVWYIDNEEVRRMTGPRVADEQLDIVAQLVIGSPNFAGPATGTQFPVEYEIDYIRVLQRP